MMGSILPKGSSEIAATAAMTIDELVQAAAFWGCKLEMTTLGPSYRVELRRTPWRRLDVGEGSNVVYENVFTSERSEVLPDALKFDRKTGSTVGEMDDVLIMTDRDLLGYTNGFVQPGGVLHLDTMQIRRFSGYWSTKGQSALAERSEAPNPGQPSASRLVMR